MARRTKAREVALQMLYQVDLNSDVDARTVREMMRERLPEDDLRDFADRLYVGTMEVRKELDERIQKIATNWKLFRMAATDRNVLRLGAFELLHTSTPHRVVIDEALELAKKFGSDQSAQFVNGILDKLVPAEQRNPADEENVADTENPPDDGSASITEEGDAEALTDAEVAVNTETTLEENPSATGPTH